MNQFKVGIISDWLRLPFRESMENVPIWVLTAYRFMRWREKWLRKI